MLPTDRQPFALLVREAIGRPQPHDAKTRVGVKLRPCRVFGCYLLRRPSRPSTWMIPSKNAAFSSAPVWCESLQSALKRTASSTVCQGV
jgi:hypothetical protein